jgi:DivIVA domain-containing protein
MFSGSQAAGSSLLSPLDIQNKEFRLARMTGYRMRDVDEFLDQITDAMGALIAENERLRAAINGSGSTDSDQSTGGTSSDDVAAIQSFLRRERDFLRSLGVLVQGHAEQMKEMARSARLTTATKEQASEPEPEPESASASVGESEAGTDDEPKPTIAAPREETSAPDVEPVRVDEPEPASMRSNERRTEGSLRELFWGEEG